MRVRVCVYRCMCVCMLRGAFFTSIGAVGCKKPSRKVISLSGKIKIKESFSNYGQWRQKVSAAGEYLNEGGEERRRAQKNTEYPDIVACVSREKWKVSRYIVRVGCERESLSSSYTHFGEISRA